MSKITNGGLTRSGRGSCTHRATVSVKGLITPNIMFCVSRNRNYSVQFVITQVLMMQMSSAVRVKRSRLSRSQRVWAA